MAVEINGPSALTVRAFLRQLRSRGAQPAVRCPACDGVIGSPESSVRLHGALYHAGCALYRRRGDA